MNRFSFGDFSIVALGKVINVGLQAIFYLIFAALLEPERFGQMSYLIAIAGTVSIVSRFGLQSTIIVYRGKNEETISDQINILALILTTVIAIILVPIDVTAALLSITLSYFVMSQQNLIGQKRYKKFLFISILKSGSVLIIPVILYFVLDIPGIVLGLAIANFLGSFDFLKTLNFKIKSFSGLKINFKVILHNFGETIASGLPKWIDKIVILPIVGFANVGMYQFNLQILLGFEILPLAMQSFLLSEESSGKSHNNLAKLMILISILVVVSVILLSPFAVEQFFPKYTDGILGLQIMIVALIPLTLSAIISAKLQAKKSTMIGYTAPIRLGSLIILLILLGERFDLLGLSIAVLSSIMINTIFLGLIYGKIKR